MPRRPAAEQNRFRTIWTLLRWQRSVTNADVRSVTGVETVQASRLLKALAEANPTALEIDRSAKKWRLTSEAPAKAAGGGLDEYLVVAPNESRGWAHDARPSFLEPSESSVALIRQACQEGRGLELLYASVASGASTSRTLYPHTLVRTAARWHVRAWCPSRQQYRDFNVGRMSGLRITPAPGASLPRDAQWENLVKLRIVPHPLLEAEAERAVRKEYFNDAAARVISVREALVPYLLQDLRVAVDPQAQRPPDYLLSTAGKLARGGFSRGQ